MRALTELGRAGRHWRIEADMTQKEHAALIGVSPQFLSAVERGTKKMPYEVILRSPAALRRHYLLALLEMKRDELRVLEFALNATSSVIEKQEHAA